MIENKFNINLEIRNINSKFKPNSFALQDLTQLQNIRILEVVVVLLLLLNLLNKNYILRKLTNFEPKLSHYLNKNPDF